MRFWQQMRALSTFYALGNRLRTIWQQPVVEQATIALDDY